ncbi:hypothetical protein MtrunA17_Chr4g0066411 [Medicago truncatula]|uniref:Galactose oxidase n=1 Tax=Medicago truncatula TaxID=3880 RepID=G7JHV7_MEDTR|nr:galactose oxidase [Medicago truncatula]RHN64192.1 hypothetical protein MtrunA17_Chr4g0066411 [Medicago truncatula]
MAFPDDRNRGPSPKHCCLWVFREFLSVWAMERATVEIWVMKEYKVHSSWTKTLVLSISGIPYFSPICCTKSGHIIGTDGYNRLMKYDDKGRLFERHTHFKDKNYHRSRVAMYTESLLSLPIDNMQG